MNEVEETSSVGATAGEILSNDPERTFVLLINLSANDMYVGLTPAVSSTNGIKLTANGGTLILNAKEEYTLTTRSFNAIADVAASTLYLLTMRRDAANMSSEA